MMRTSLAALAACLAFVLCGCAGHPYRPFDGRVGYSEAEVQPGVFDVSFQGTDRMSSGRATELARLRAAELADSRGASHFRLVGRSSGARTSIRSGSSSVGVGTGVGVGSNTGVGVGTRFPLSGVDVDSRPVSTVTVELLDAPADDAFETRAILDDAIARNLVTPDRLGAPARRR